MCCSQVRRLSAQTPAPRAGTLRLFVRDATDLAVSGAAVTVTAATGVTRAAVANERGEAIFDNLAPGEYVARIESPGFTPVDVTNLRVRSGAQTSRNVSLAIASLTEEIDVSPPEDDAQLLGAFTEQLTAEQIAALPDDPEELAQVLQQLIGDDADIRVNGFAGGRLPPGTQIQDIRVRYDSASGSGNGGPRVEIRTQPGSRRLAEHIQHEHARRFDERAQRVLRENGPQARRVSTPTPSTARS